MNSLDIKSITDRVLLPEKRDVLRVHLYFKLVQYGIRAFENDIDIILELYQCGGYSNREEQLKFIESCKTKNLKKSDQSIRNTLSKYVNNGVFLKPKNRTLKVDERFIPEVSCDKLMLNYMISHAE